MLKYARFDLFFRGVWELHAFVREELDPVVLKRIVRGRNDDANMKVIVANETSDAGCGQDAGKRDRSTARQEACGDDTGNVWAGFAGVRADQGVGRSVVAVKIFRNGDAESKKRSVVEGRSSWDAADTVRSEELSRHRVRGRRAPTDKKFSTAIRKSRGAA